MKKILVVCICISIMTLYIITVTTIDSHAVSAARINCILIIT